MKPRGTYSVSKSYRDFPAAHRQPNHHGHCRLIHGHNWGFDIHFSCGQLDENGFVVDVGMLGVVKAFLQEDFDHTLLLNESDPALKSLQMTLGDNAGGEILFAKIVVVPNCGMEGLAKYVAEEVTGLIASGAFPGFLRLLKVTSVTCWEDSKNSATYVMP